MSLFVNGIKNSRGDRSESYPSTCPSDYNEGDLLTLPTYMQFLLDLEPEEIVLEPIDTDSINSLAREILGK